MQRITATLSLLSPILFLLPYPCLAQDSTTNPEDQFVAPYNSEKEPGEPVSPKKALEMLQLPEGFEATLFAAEPDVMNPIAATTDAQGRVWVAENFTYAERGVNFDLNLSDRVIVLEDEDGDGVAEKRTVFADNLKVLTGIVVGRGGVWLMTPPQLLFIPDADGDLVPDGPPQVKLDGFHLARENYHNFANGLSWGPDNWLYGRCGASSPGEMGLPGSTDEARIPIRGGMWRFHPERQVVEALVQGTTNPWGNDWNELGDLFFINTVNGHFWHCIPGAHFVRPHTLDLNPYSYELIDMHADHWHFDTGKSWTASRDGAANDFGGGHAHIGLMLYQENHWPAQYQGKVMTVNMHGRRINVESLHRDGSGYVASHEPDFVISGDEWFRGMEILPQPDGNVLLIDWSDTGECHDHTGVHRTSGRIFKISLAGKPPVPNALQRDSVRSDPLALAKLQTNAPEWTTRRARELLAQHALTGKDISAAVAYASTILRDENAPIQHRLRALWAINAMNAFDEDTRNYLLTNSEEHLRTWGVRLSHDAMRLDTAFGKRPFDAGKTMDVAFFSELVALATVETSAKVRLEFATLLQKLPFSMRAMLAKALVIHSEDANDHNLPLMVWYGLSPLGEDHVADLNSVLNVCTWPKTRQLISRRIADRSKRNHQGFEDLFAIAAKQDVSFKKDVVLGTSEAFAGWSRAKKPSSWNAIREGLGGQLGSDSSLSKAVQNLNLLFGDGRTLEQLMKLAGDGQVALELRKSALQTLVDANATGINQLCLKLLNTRFLNTVAATGLARRQEPEIGVALVRNYRRFHPSERTNVISILCSRSSWSQELLKAVANGKIDRSEISAFQARQIASQNNERSNELLAQNWGQVRVSSEAKKKLMTTLRQQLVDHQGEGVPSAGRALFAKSCASCHKLFGEGGNLGPDLTGAQRSNLDYLLENIIDPSAVVTKEFRATIIRTEDDRVLTGLLTERNENVVTLATQNEVFKIPADEIVQMKQSDQSTMPEGLLDQLSAEQRRDLFAYLQSTSQVD